MLKRLFCKSDKEKQQEPGLFVANVLQGISSIITVVVAALSLSFVKNRLLTLSL